MTISSVGAGLGGLALARVLHMNGIDAVVYERESSRGARGQGGMLDLHSGTGQRALREAGLLDRFHAIARREGQDLQLLEPDGTLLLQEHTPDDAPLERTSAAGRQSAHIQEVLESPDAGQKMLAFFQPG